ncbi:polyprenyl synthetase family protein [Desulfonatronovibrio hydrogenovorans]|uniref:polyprenyl synthetase family protein n=1 Tax=Desulfonatronovibrio hydrogenovorans TaxID=53245 RepID=UPI0004902912|nr:polyprenyl synthetase family protein [Desulfonatronovibrio hydrogenovorans]
MKKLKDFFAGELPVVNKVLYQEIKGLNPLVREVGEHVLMAGGKRLRPMLTILTAACFGGSKKDIHPLACSLELLHSATLIHDDILDNANVRRGRESVHLVFGLKRAILAGDAFLALANMIVARYDVPAMNFCVAEAIQRTVTGEILEIDNLRNPEMDEQAYLEIVTGKTAYLIQAACSCGAMAAGVAPDILDKASSFGLNLGIAFQLVDDALDYAADAELLGKPLGGDLKEGKITLPLILHLKSLPGTERNELLERISADSLDQDEIQNIIKSIQQAGLDRRVRARADEYLKSAGLCLDVFPASPQKELLEEMLELVRTRRF